MKRGLKRARAAFVEFHVKSEEVTVVSARLASRALAVRKQWVLLIDLPFTVRELVAKGYRSFRMEAEEDTKRVELRAWKGQKTKAR